jgi:hypothetical protein
MPFAALFSWFAALFGKDAKNLGFNLAKYAAWSAYALFTLGVFLAAVFTILDGIAVSVPSQAVQVWGWFMPPNAAGCLIAIMSVRILRAAYDFKIAMSSKKLEMVRSS